jgi:hypothetical protein
MGFYLYTLDTDTFDKGNSRFSHDRGHRRGGSLPISTQMKESPGDHVPRSAAKGIKDKEPHKVPVPINPCVYDF